MMPSDRKFMQRRRAFQLEQSLFNNGIEKTREFRVKELNAQFKVLRKQYKTLRYKAATVSTILSEEDFMDMRNGKDKTSGDVLRAWSLAKYGILVERNQTAPYAKRMIDLLEKTLYERSPVQKLPSRSKTTGFQFHVPAAVSQRDSSVPRGNTVASRRNTTAPRGNTTSRCSRGPPSFAQHEPRPSRYRVPRYQKPSEKCTTKKTPGSPATTKDKAFYRSKRSGSIIIPNPINYNALKIVM